MRSFCRLFVLLFCLKSASVVFSDAATPPRALVIEHGGTFHGSWFSDDPNVPAILIGTSDPVVIEESTVQGRGPLIATKAAHAKVTVRNTRGIGLNPNVAGATPGRFFTGESCDQIIIEHCDLEHTAGIYILGYGGDLGANQTIKIRFNRVSNIDGRISNGHGGFVEWNQRRLLAGGPSEKGYVEAQFVQLDKVRHVPGIDIGWNQIVNEPGNSRVEDNISIYLSSGAAASPIRIHDNLIRGAYTIQPRQNDTRDATCKYDWSYSGGGIMLGDGSAANPQDAAAYAEALGNVVIATTNYGIAISAGHDLTFHDNRIIACGKLADGRAIAAQNVGAYIWDSHHDAAKSPPTFFNNIGRDNWIGWMKQNSRNDSWHPNAAQWQANHAIDGPLTIQTEQAELQTWQRRAYAAGLTIGVSPARNVTPPHDPSTNSR